MDKCKIENVDLSEATLKLIWHCTFDSQLHIWKPICFQQLYQQAQTGQWGAALTKTFMWFILLGDSFPHDKKKFK